LLLSQFVLLSVFDVLALRLLTSVQYCEAVLSECLSPASIVNVIELIFTTL